MIWLGRWVAFGESSMKPTPVQLCCGSSSSSTWTQHTSKGLYTDVKTSGCEFKNTPHFFTSLTDKACGSELLGSARCTAKAVGQNAIYSSSKGGFRVYTQPTPGGANFNYATSRANGWQLNWCGISSLPPTDSGSAGYPCKLSPISLVCAHVLLCSPWGHCQARRRACSRAIMTTQSSRTTGRFAATNRGELWFIARCMRRFSFPTSDFEYIRSMF